MSRTRIQNVLEGAFALTLGLTIWGSVVGAEQLANGKSIDFNRDVRPILAQHCFKCHGADEHARQAKLRLDVAESAYGAGESGERAIVPGKPDESELVRRIFSDNDEVMPPKHTKTTMPDASKEILKAWVASGANYQKHWAYMPPRRPEVGSSLALQFEEARREKIHPIDFFVRHRLQQEKLKPSPKADPYTLVRRVYLDLIGLPPTASEADAFVQDPSEANYQRLVDGLLDSPQYGERWARRWLDLARYADTNGFEKDRARTIWPYRDWVVKALNADMPYDQFSIKQLAGDMLPDATADDRVATGFHRNTMLNEEGGIDPLEYRFYAMVDRVGVTGTTWLGLTLSCAQCHTHKYDPIQHADFYRLMALLNNASEPTFFIPNDEVLAQQRSHQLKIAQMESALASQYPGGEEALSKALNLWIEEQRVDCSHWEVLSPAKMETSLPQLKIQPDGFILGSGDITKSDRYQLTLQAKIQDVRALRIEVASHPSLPNYGPGMTDYEGPIGGFFLSELQVEQNGDRLKLSRAEATNEEEEDRINDGAGANKVNVKPRAKAKAANAAKTKKNSAQAALDGEMSSGWQVLGGYGVQHAAVFYFDEPVDLAGGIDLTMLFEKHFACPLGHFRISVTTSDHAKPVQLPADIEELVVRSQATLVSTEREKLRQYFLEVAPEMEKAAAPLHAARAKPPRGQPTLVMQERPQDNPRPTHRYHRGEYLQPRELVSAGVPAFLPPLDAEAAANRLTFARWLFAAENPLTARVAVNRQWQAFFGRGLVKSLEDFGYQSDPPSHPELLDWLAVEFVAQGWSMKKLHRLIVTSETYQQTSRISEELARRDPENILLARASRFRMDAEIIRDASLKAAGILSAKMGGPGVYPPQPASVTTEGTYGKVEWKTSEGEDRYRRSLYTFIKRTAPFAMASTFDAPTGESCLARRDVSNSPLQALTLLNDLMFMEAAEGMAGKVLVESDSDSARIHNIFRRVITRPPSEEETEMMSAFLKSLRSRKLDEPALWASVCRAVLNLDESITHP